MATCAIALAAVVAALPVAALKVSSSRGFLTATTGHLSGMRPEEVARTLVGVEERWENMASSFVACTNVAITTGASNAECDSFLGEFTGSCAKVAIAMVKGSGGKRNVVKEYMDAVCSASPLKNWRRERCQLLAVELNAAMTDDAYYNRERLDLTNACRKFWDKFTVAAKERAEKEEAERAEKAKRQAEKQRKAEEKRATEALERKKAEEKRAAEVAAEAKRQEAEAKRQEAKEATERAEQANAKAAEAAERLTKAKAEQAAQTEEAAQKSKANAEKEEVAAKNSSLVPRPNVTKTATSQTNVTVSK